MVKKNKIKLIIGLGILAVILVLATWSILMKTSGKLIFVDKTTNKINSLSTNDLEPLNNNVPPRDPNLNNEQNLIKDYIVSHLSELSPTKEILGGKFYLTKITFTDKQGANISYEDGHVALQAKITYELNREKLRIIDFIITKEN